MLKNIENFRTSGVEIKDEWIKQENLTFKIPERILQNMGAKDYQTNETDLKRDRSKHSNSAVRDKSSNKKKKSTRSTLKLKKKSIDTTKKSIDASMMIKLNVDTSIQHTDTSMKMKIKKSSTKKK